MDGSILATLAGVVLGFLACSITCVVCRIWRRNRYYKKVQRSLDAEEAAFQETLSRNFRAEAQLDAADQAKLQMLESYMASAGMAEEAATGSAAPLPTRAEDVDKFMSDLAAAAAGEVELPAVKEPGKAAAGSGR